MLRIVWFALFAAAFGGCARGLPNLEGRWDGISETFIISSEGIVVWRRAQNVTISGSKRNSTILEIDGTYIQSKDELTFEWNMDSFQTFVFDGQKKIRPKRDAPPLENLGTDQPKIEPKQVFSYQIDGRHLVLTGENGDNKKLSRTKKTFRR